MNIEQKLNFQPKEAAEQKLVLKGEKKQLFVSLKVVNGELVMSDYIENKFHTEQNTTGETTFLYLTALEFALTRSAQLNLPLRWDFNPADPGHKMEKWFESIKTKVKTSVQQSEIPSELSKIKEILQELNSLKVNITQWDALTYEEINKLKPGEKLEFDSTDEGNNLASQFGRQITLIKVLSTESNKQIPLLKVKTLKGETTVSAQRIKYPNAISNHSNP